MKWTFTMIFQELMNALANKYYMFLIDDFGLKRPYDEFVQMMEFIRRDSSHLGNRHRLFN